MLEIQALMARHGAEAVLIAHSAAEILGASQTWRKVEPRYLRE
jgi:hypothetical protein